VNDPQGARRLPDRTAYLVIAAISAALLGFLFWLIYFRSPSEVAPGWSRGLPAANAVFNGCSALCLVIAVAAIRRKRIRLHVGFVLTALTFSGLFLISYIVHHTFQGDTRFPGQGWIRPVYFFILISHILLSIAVVPMIFTTLFFALTGRFPRHRRLARFTFPVWLYVSVTGVAVFFLLSVYV
jgi:putative membrane protein